MALQQNVLRQSSTDDRAVKHEARNSSGVMVAAPEARLGREGNRSIKATPPANRRKYGRRRLAN